MLHRRLANATWATFSNLLTTPYSIVDTIEKAYVFSQITNKPALSLTLTKSAKIEFPIRFRLMLHRSLANATQVSLCESNPSVEAGEHEKRSE